MDLKALKTFHRIVALGSFQRAAEELNYAPSTVTAQIQQLEGELSVTLLERGKRLRLTEAGRLFHEQSASIVHQMQRVRGLMADWQTGEAGSVRLGAVEPAASCRLPGIVAKLLAAYPHIQLSVDIANTPALTERVLRGELDLAVCSAPQPSSELIWEPLFTERFVTVLPAGHALAERELVQLEDLQPFRLLITAKTCPYRQKLDQLLHAAGHLPADTLEIGSMTALIHYAAAGLGLALVPAVAAAAAPPAVTVRPLPAGALDMSCGLLCRAADAPLRLAPARLYGLLRSELAGQPAQQPR